MHITVQNPHHAMLLARGYAISSYSELEQSLCMLFGALTNLDPAVSGLIFFRIINTKSRLAILEGLFKRKFNDEFRFFRNSIIKHVRDLDSTRNSIIHWAAISQYSSSPTITLGETPPDDVYLTPPNFWWRSDDTPELTIDNLITFCDRCSVVARAVNIFSVHFVRDVPSITENERASWRERFSQPLPYPLPEDHPLYAPPAMRKNQPPPSQE